MARRKSDQQDSKQGHHWELPAGSHVWLYLRHSPGDSQTIDSQERGMREWCAVMGWVIVGTFVDEALKGGTDEREQLQEMMRQARRKPRTIDGVLVWDFSRFARNIFDAQFYRAELRKLGYVVQSKIDDIPNNDMAFLMEAFIDLKNTTFLKDLSLNVKRGHEYIVSQGCWPGSRIPTGYRIERVELGRRHTGAVRYGNRLVKDEEMHERVALAWKMKLEQNAGYVPIQDATQLHRWHGSYSQMFSNLIYAGIFEFQGKRYPLNWEQGARFCEPYVTLEQFEQVQRNREQRSRATIAPRSLSSPYLLSGLAQCGLCAAQGKTVHLLGNKQQDSNYRYYKCAHKLRASGGPCALPQMAAYRLDEAVLRVLREQVLTPEFVRAEVERANAMLGQVNHDVEQHVRQAKQMEQQRRRDVEHVVELIRRKGMTAILETQYDEVNTAWQDAQTRLAIAEALPAQQAAYVPMSLTDAYHLIDDMLVVLQSDMVEQQRRVVTNFVQSIVVYPGRVELIMKFHLPSLTISLPPLFGAVDSYAVNALLTHVELSIAKTHSPSSYGYCATRSSLPVVSMRQQKGHRRCSPQLR